MLKSLKRLYAKGYALHWLHKKSKRPIGEKWSQGPRKSLEELTQDYRPGYNLGVRLGSPSKIGDRYLAVIDCDVKSSDPKHLAEMETKLKELGVNPLTLTVLSGRGNGSRHLYVSTRKPCAPRRLAQSPEQVAVLMPSVNPSTNDLAKLSEAKIYKGYRLRAAWEISLMGEGQQVVVPPSVHPDSGKAYVYDDTTKGSDIAEFKDGGGASGLEKIKSKLVDTWEPANHTVDLVGSSLSDDVVNQIISGVGVSDRSAALFGVSIAMQKAGFSEEEILTVLTDKRNYLGAVAYDHTKSESRKRAAEWVLNFTLRKAKRESTAKDDFTVYVEGEDAQIDKQAAAEAAKELVEANDWRALLERNLQDGRPRNTLKNLRIIFENLSDGEPFVSHDEFSIEDKWVKDMPWGVTIGAAISDKDCRRIKDYLSKHFRMEPDVVKILEALLICADSSRFHPVRDYLDGLQWDGVERAERWLIDYLGAHGASEEYIKAVGLKTLVAMVARIYEPGIKFDHVLILEGDQGAGKSSAARILSDPWFSDAFLNISDKDAVMNMQGVWVNELGELNAMSKSEVNAIKDFVTRQEDKIRPPYGRLSITYPRQNVFIGTTNNKDYLKDKTGNRRFWPVRIKRLKRKALKHDRDQILAEAFAWYQLGEPLYLSPAQSLLATREQNLRMETDDLQQEIEFFLSAKGCKLKEFTFFELCEEGPPAMSGLKNDRATQMRIAGLLRNIGYDNVSLYDQNLKRTVRKWRKVSDLTTF